MWIAPAVVVVHWRGPPRWLAPVGFVKWKQEMQAEPWRTWRSHSMAAFQNSHPWAGLITPWSDSGVFKRSVQVQHFKIHLFLLPLGHAHRKDIPLCQDTFDRTAYHSSSSTKRVEIFFFFLIFIFFFVSLFLKPDAEPAFFLSFFGKFAEGHFYSPTRFRREFELFPTRRYWTQPFPLKAIASHCYLTVVTTKQNTNS